MNNIGLIIFICSIILILVYICFKVLCNLYIFHLNSRIINKENLISTNNFDESESLDYIFI